MGEKEGETHGVIFLLCDTGQAPSIPRARLSSCREEGPSCPHHRAVLRRKWDICDHTLVSSGMACMGRDWTSAWPRLAQEAPGGEMERLDGTL